MPSELEGGLPHMHLGEKLKLGNSPASSYGLVDVAVRRSIEHMTEMHPVVALQSRVILSTTAGFDIIHVPVNVVRPMCSGIKAYI